MGTVASDFSCSMWMAFLRVQYLCGNRMFVLYVLLGISPASNYSWPTFRNPVSVTSSKAGCRL